MITLDKIKELLLVGAPAAGLAVSTGALVLNDGSLFQIGFGAYLASGLIGVKYMHNKDSYNPLGLNNIELAEELKEEAQTEISSLRLNPGSGDYFGE
jgi:hypothetical protein